MSAASSIAGLAGVQSNSAAAAGAAKNELGRDDFLKLMMAQMRNQNPMEPLKDTEFVAQLAQFSQLDGIDKLNTSISSLLLMQGLTQSTNLIGKNVAYSADGTGTNLANGKVDSVAVVSGQIQLVIGGKPVQLSQVQAIQAGTLAA